MFGKRVAHRALILFFVLSLAGQCIAQDPVPANAEDLFIPNRVRLGAFLKAARTTRISPVPLRRWRRSGVCTLR